MTKNEKKRFLLRLDGDLFEALERWAAQELRSVNGQIEYILHEAVRTTGRSRSSGDEKTDQKDGRKKT